MSEIKLADALVLPQNAATQVYAFMGRRGSGKTYAAGRFTEQLLDAGHQVVVLDPVGVWWGLRLAADGKRPGLKVPVFGGIHGDIVLEPTAGKVVAELVAEQRTSLVLDVSDFTQADQRRFVADFATDLFHAKKRNRSAVMVVLDEAQDFAPQNPEPGDTRMLGAIQRMAKLGRNFGIGVALLSQRPQDVNKKALNLSEVLVAFQLTGPQERKAIAGWVQEKGEGDRADIGLELPSLPVGTALVWSPQWLNVFGRYKILPKRTYDASATPDQAVATACASLAPIDLDLVRKAMADTIEATKQKDPKALRERVAELERQLADPTHASSLKVALDDYKAEMRGATGKEITRLRALEDKVVAFVQESGLFDVRERLGQTVNGTSPRSSRGMPTNPDGHKSFRLDHEAVAAIERKVRKNPNWGTDRETPSPANGEALGGGPTEVLVALASIGGQATRRQLATLAGYRPTVSTLRNYMSILKGKELLAVDGDVVVITPAGRALVGEVERKTAPELLSLWRGRIKGKPAEILSLFAAEHGPFTSEVIQRRCNVPPGQSTLRNYLSILRANDLIQKGRGGYVVNPLLRH
jgi:uncharacterized protein